MFQTALNAQRVNSLVKTAETMGVLDPASERAKQADLDEILGFLAALEKVINIPYILYWRNMWGKRMARSGAGKVKIGWCSLLPISLQQLITSLPKKEKIVLPANPFPYKSTSSLGLADRRWEDGESNPFPTGSIRNPLPSSNSCPWR